MLRTGCPTRVTDENQQRNQCEYENGAKDIDASVGNDAGLRTQLPVHQTQRTGACRPRVRSAANHRSGCHLEAAQRRRIAAGNVFGQNRAKLRGVMREQSRNRSDAERTAKLSEEIVEAGSL